MLASCTAPYSGGSPSRRQRFASRPMVGTWASFIQVRHQRRSSFRMLSYKSSAGDFGAADARSLHGCRIRHSTRKDHDYNAGFLDSHPELAEGNVNTIKLNRKQNVTRWRNGLAPEEVARIRERVEPIASRSQSDGVNDFIVCLGYRRL
jgi:hypothetical protein